MKNKVEKIFFNILEKQIKEISNAHCKLENKYIKGILKFLKLNSEMYGYTISNTNNDDIYVYSPEDNGFIKNPEHSEEDDGLDDFINEINEISGDEESKIEQTEAVPKPKPIIVNEKEEQKIYKDEDNIYSIYYESITAMHLNVTDLVCFLSEQNKVNDALDFKNGVFDLNIDESNNLNTIVKLKKITQILNMFSRRGQLEFDTSTYKFKNQNIKNFFIYYDLKKEFDLFLSYYKKLDINILSEALYLIALIFQELSTENKRLLINEDKYYQILNNENVILNNEITNIKSLFYKIKLGDFCHRNNSEFILKEKHIDLELPENLYDSKIKNRQNNSIKLDLEKIVENDSRLKRLNDENKKSQKFNFYNEEDYYNLIKTSGFISNRDDKHLYNSESTYAKVMELSKNLHLYEGLSSKDPSENIISNLEEIKLNFPNFKDVTNYIILSIKASIIAKSMIKINPILLTGNAGVGKTNYCKEIAKCFDMYLNIIGMQQVANEFELCGLSYGYATGDTGKIYKSLVRSNIINPIILLDEIDKTQSNISGATPSNAMIAALEPSTAKNYYENSLELCINVSHVNWIATANDLYMIPKHLLSRFRVFKINNPKKEDSVSIIKNIYKTIRSESLVKAILDENLTEITTLKIKSMADNPRDMSFLLREAIDNAISEIDEKSHISKISISPNHIVKRKKIY